MTDPLLEAVGAWRLGADLFARRWEDADESGREFLVEVLRDACDRTLKALDEHAAEKAAADGEH